MKTEILPKLTSHSIVFNIEKSYLLKEAQLNSFTDFLVNSSFFRVCSKSNLHYTRRITPKRVTSCGAHLRGLAPGQHSSEKTSQRWRVVGDTVSN